MVSCFIRCPSIWVFLFHFLLIGQAVDRHCWQKYCWNASLSFPVLAIMGFMMLLWVITGDTELSHFIKVGSGSFLHCKVSIFSLYRKKYHEGDTLRLCSCCFFSNLYLLILASIMGLVCSNYYCGVTCIFYFPLSFCTY